VLPFTAIVVHVTPAPAEAPAVLPPPGCSTAHPEALDLPASHTYGYVGGSQEKQCSASQRRRGCLRRWQCRFGCIGAGTTAIGSSCAQLRLQRCSIGGCSKELQCGG
jgi:hypothetical protein